MHLDEPDPTAADDPGLGLVLSGGAAFGAAHVGALQVLEERGIRPGIVAGTLAWRVRGLMDRLSGGPGLRRGRRDENTLVVDDVLDFWRVEAIEPGRRLLLRAEMRLPGLAWLELRVDEAAEEVAEPDDVGPAPEDASGPCRTYFAQRALFYPHGLAGQAYWWSVKPFHGVVFGGMQKNIAEAAERAAAAARTGPGTADRTVTPPR